MHVVFGASGQTGSRTAHALLDRHQPVRAVVRNPQKAQALADRGAEVVTADVHDAASLLTALRGATSAYVLNPPDYRVADMRADSTQVARNFRHALQQAGTPCVVVLSSVGAHLPTDTGNILTTHDLEQTLADAAPQVTRLRCAWFADNWAGVAPIARQKGILPSLLLPLDKEYAFVSSADIGRTAARLLTGELAATPVVELEGPRRYSPQQVAAAFGEVLGQPVQAVPVTDAELAPMFTSWGCSPDAVQNWVAMVRGFNHDHIVWEGGHPLLRGETTMAEVARELLARPARSH